VLDGATSIGHIAVGISQQEASLEGQRTGGMTVIAVLNIIVGGLAILSGLFQGLGALMLMFELLRVGAFDIPVAHATFSLLLLATGIIGITAGIKMFALRASARPLSLAFAGLSILSAAFSFLTVPIIASIGTYDIGSLSSYNLARLTIFSVIYVVLPVSYAVVLCAVFYQPAWKAAFATGR
jgi:hypothetical protein